MSIEENPIDEIGLVPCCKSCGSELVVRDAWACWNREAGLWELQAVFDQDWCRACDAKTQLTWTRPEQSANQAIRELNDAFRIKGQGNGTLVVTHGIVDRGQEFLGAVITAMREFQTFSEDNDPHGEHDFGSIEIEGSKVFWKIDYYDLSMSGLSENPANPGLTKRVLTVMLADEY